MTFKIPEKYKQLQKDLYAKKYIIIGDTEIHVSHLKDRSVNVEKKQKMRMNSYAQDDLYPKLDNEALIYTARHFIANCSTPRFPCATYDESLIHMILPELIKRLEGLK